MGGSSTTVQKSDPWGPAQPFILEGLQSASGMWNADPNQFVVDPWMGPAVAREDPALQAARDEMGGYSYQGPPTPQLPELRRPPPAPDGGGGGGGSGGGSGTPPWLTGGGGTTPPPPGWAPTGSGGTPISNAKAPSSQGAPQTFSQTQPYSGAQIQTRSAGGMAPDGPNPNSLVERQKYLAEQSQYGVNQIGQQASRNPQDAAFRQGINLGMDQTNDARFTSAINNMTGDGYDQQLRNQLRENVSASVMPGMNATFANSGMTGSGLHQQNLAKGLSAGMANAEAEFLNRAQDRQFEAGMAGQSALEAARARALGAGTLAQQAGMDNREQALRAYGLNNQMQQGAYNPYLQQQAVGEARTREAQQQLAADIMAHQQAQAGPIDAINNYLSLTSGLGGEFGQSATTSKNNPGLFGILGGLGQMLPFF